MRGRTVNWLLNILLGRKPVAPPALPAALCFDRAALEKEGFPTRVSQAFLDTATQLDCAIASRCPGEPATQLVEDGHDLKSFLIHAKSCNWGPMAGFVCQLPPLNKKGPGNAAFNLEEHVNSIAKFAKLMNQAVTKHGGGDSESVKNAAELEGLATWPFVPTGISLAALERLFAGGFLDAAYC
jgi:hypothetical protein